MTTAPRVDEIEALRILMAQYALWGDTQQWDKFGSLFHDEAVVIIDAGPRPNPESDPRVNLVGYALGAKYAIPQMISQGGLGTPLIPTGSTQ